MSAKKILLLPSAVICSAPHRREYITVVDSMELNYLLSQWIFYINCERTLQRCNEVLVVFYPKLREGIRALRCEWSARARAGARCFAIPSCNTCFLNNTCRAAQIGMNWDSRVLRRQVALVECILAQQLDMPTFTDDSNHHRWHFAFN